MAASNTWEVPLTLLNWCLEERGAFLVTDSLLSIAGGDLVSFSTKVHQHPRLKLMVVGTGKHQLVRRFDDYVGAFTLARDIDGLVEEAKPILMALWDGEVMAGEKGTATVYLFGFSSADRIVKGYRFASGDSFAPEALPLGFAIKPPLEDMEPINARAPNFGIDDLLYAAELQHAEDLKRRTDEPVEIPTITEDGSFNGAIGIGGDLVGYWIQTTDDDHVMMTSEVMGSLEGHDADEEACRKRGLAGPAVAVREIYRRQVVEMTGDFAGAAFADRWPIERMMEDAQQ
ncbi:MAG: hypothetical protein ACRED4_02750 [Brevundimonas sp.]